MNPLKISSLLFGALGISGVSLYGTYESTKKTFLDNAQGTVVSTDDSEKGSEAWIGLAKYLKEEVGKSTSSDAASKEFLEIKDENDSGEKLRQLCKKTANAVYKTIFTKLADQLLSYSFANFCQTTLWSALGSEKAFEIPEGKDKESKDKEKIKERLKELKSHANSDDNGTLEKDQKLKAIKDKYSSDKQDNEESWKALLEWCGNKYDENYSNKENNTWKLVKKYCSK